MAIRTVAQKNSLASKYAADAAFAALFTADPGATGGATGEVTGGSPAYARKAITWSAPADGKITAQVVFDVPGGVTVAFSGVTTAGVAGTADVRDTFDQTDQAFASQGTYTLDLSYTQT